MRIRWIIGLAFAVLAALGSTASAQTGIGLNPSSTQKVTFTATGVNNTAAITLGTCVGTTCTLSGSATFGDQVGKYTFTTNTRSGNVFASYSPATAEYSMSNGGALTTFTFAINGQTWLTADVTWTYIVDSNKPQMNATLTNIVVNPACASNPACATPEFIATFSNPQAALDMTINKLACSGLASGKPCTLTGIFASGGSASGGATISSGQLVSVPVPEPATLALLGTGMFAVGAAVRRRVKK